MVRMHALTNNPTFAKPYELTYELRPGYLYVKVRARTISYKIARAYWNEVLVMLSRFRRERVLIDKDIWATLSAADAFQIASEVAGEFRSAKLAVCDRHSTQVGIEFGEMVATNRGLNTRSFSDIDAAKDWLMQDRYDDTAYKLSHTAHVSRSELGVL